MMGHPLRSAGTREGWDTLLEWIGDARIVLLGEASHGTHEFYRARARITERLVRERGFGAIAIEGDWPDAHRVNRFVRGVGRDRSPEQALSGFIRFPQWMWRNTDVVELCGTLRELNRSRDEADQVGCYGLDVYSLHASMAHVVEYLTRIDPEAGRAARERYACFDAHGQDAQRYGFLVARELAPSCEDDAISVMVKLAEERARYLERDGSVAEDAQFCAEQNARVVANAERYYREAFQGRISSWNLRDQHMADTLDALLEHSRKKIVVWAHNSHVGDARATSMSRRGELNLGQLMRERHGRDVFIVGQTTYDGEVAAASEWDGPVQKKRVLPARPDSVEWQLHHAQSPAFYLDLRELSPSSALHQPLLERAIGVIYRPETELASHYFETTLTRQFDALVHFDRTRAVTPLERRASWDKSELPETFPTGI